jgi:hypothetical protein
MTLQPHKLARASIPGSDCDDSMAAIKYLHDAVETASRPSNRGAGAMLFIFTFAIIAVGAEVLWLGFLTWVFIWAIF